MAAAHTAYILDDGDDTIVRVTGKLHLQPGPVLLSEDIASGNVTLSPVASAPSHLGDWNAFFRFKQTVEVPESFMDHRAIKAPAETSGVFDEE